MHLTEVRENDCVIRCHFCDLLTLNLQMYLDKSVDRGERGLAQRTARLNDGLTGSIDLD